MHYVIGESQILPETRQVLRKGKNIHCEPLTFDLLLFFIQNANTLLERQVLLDTIWQGRIVTDGSLSNEIKELRKVLGDSITHQRYIRTVPKIGYQFVHSIRKVD